MRRSYDPSDTATTAASFGREAIRTNTSAIEALQRNPINTANTGKFVDATHETPARLEFPIKLSDGTVSGQISYHFDTERGNVRAQVTTYDVPGDENTVRTVYVDLPEISPDTSWRPQNHDRVVSYLTGQNTAFTEQVKHSINLTQEFDKEFKIFLEGLSIFGRVVRLSER